ncbi:TPA_asm: P overlapped [Wetland metagenome associated alphacytorhabdovirus 1]|nr:TPA_asm: P overlapped [Wetland metagenome associated alphacytorhabdovirus 1]
MYLRISLLIRASVFLFRWLLETRLISRVLETPQVATILYLMSIIMILLIMMILWNTYLCLRRVMMLLLTLSRIGLLIAKRLWVGLNCILNVLGYLIRRR